MDQVPKLDLTAAVWIDKDYVHGADGFGCLCRLSGGRDGGTGESRHSGGIGKLPLATGSEMSCGCRVKIAVRWETEYHFGRREACG